LFGVIGVVVVVVVGGLGEAVTSTETPRRLLRRRRRKPGCPGRAAAASSSGPEDGQQLVLLASATPRAWKRAPAWRFRPPTPAWCTTTEQGVPTLRAGQAPAPGQLSAAAAVVVSADAGEGPSWELFFYLQKNTINLQIGKLLINF